MLEDINTGRLNIGDVARGIKKNGDIDNGVAINGDFVKMEETFTDMPILIYDGPFSEHMLKQEPKMLEGKQDITRQQAEQKVKEFMGAGEGNITFDGIEESAIESYTFSSGDISIAVTKRGGYVTYMSSSKVSDDATVTPEDCVKKAYEFLSRRGMNNMKESYYFVEEGVCTVNFAYMDGDVLCYTDLIKVGVATDSGEIVVYDARGYLTNHCERDFEKKNLSMAEAKTKLSPYLKVRNSRETLIPTDGLNEKHCYEYRCYGKGGQEVLVYINCVTGYEEQISILLYGDDGVLAV